MPQSGRFRVSLGELTVFIALVACYLSTQLQNAAPEYARFMLANGVIKVGVLGLYFFHRRLSRWIWLILATWFLRPIVDLIRAWGLRAPLSSLDAFFGGAGFLDAIVFSVVHLVGLGLMFREIRRKLAAVGSPRPAPADLPSRPPDGDDWPADVS